MKKILLLLLSLSLFNPIKTADCCTPCCYDCNSFIEEIIPNFPIEELVKQLTGESNSENYLYDDQTPNFILEQAQTNQNIPAQFINLLAGKKLVGWWRAKSIYKKIINKFLNDAIASKSLIDGLSQNLTTTNLKLIKKTITKHPHALKKFAVAASENIEAMPSSTLKFLLKKSFGDERKILEDALKKIAENTKPKSFFKLFLQQNALYLLHKNYSNYFKILIKKTKTQSEQHIQRYEKQLLKDDKVKQVIEKKEIQNFVTAIHKKEQEEQDKGRYTFVHAQQWHWHFTSDLFKKLWELQYKEIINDYHFLRFEAKNSKNQKNEIKKRVKAIKGNDSQSYWNNQKKADRLFMNHAIFGNVGNYGSFSMRYFLENYDQSDTNYSIEELFETLNLKKFYQKYATQFEQLRKLHEKSSLYGNMLLLSFSENQLKNSVIPTDFGGDRITETVNNTQTYNTKTILDALRNDPEQIKNCDEIIYCAILTQDLVLDPQNGPRIFSFNVTDEKKFKVYEQLRDEIFAELSQDVELAQKSTTIKN